MGVVGFRWAVALHMVELIGRSPRQSPIKGLDLSGTAPAVTKETQRGARTSPSFWKAC